VPRSNKSKQPREGLRKPRSKASEKSDAFIVPKKSANSRVTPEESAEGRDAANGKLAQGNAHRTQGRESVPTNLERVGHKAQHDKEVKFTNLMCHIKVPLLKQAYFRLRKDAAPGVDDVTWKDYGVGLEARLQDLQDRVHRGSYHPQPVRRVHIPKGDGRTRPLGIPSLEDKVLQQAVRMVLEPIYERMFMGFSYGFRPGRSPHRALDALAVAIEKKVNWILDADIRAFFDTVDHAWMQRFVEHRIGDRRLVRLLLKWLKAGVVENAELHEVEAGTPQGGVISPLLANIYLHYVFDLWVHAWRKKHARAEVYVVRYADDVVLGFKDGRDAQSMRKALRERLSKFGLKLHPDKTRLLAFGRYAWDRAERQGKRKPETFDFLGFTHISLRDKRGWFKLQRQTSRKKRQAKLSEVRKELRRRRHAALSETHVWLSSVLTGHYNYYGVPGNQRGLRTFRAHLQYAWYRQLSRRSQRAQLYVRDMQRIEARHPLPKPRITHPWPEERFRGP
jgi:group II intron reverse transcriptase/maturase